MHRHRFMIHSWVVWDLRFAQVTLKRSTRQQKNSAVQIDVREDEDAFYARVTFMLTKILLFLSHSHLHYAFYSHLLR